MESSNKNKISLTLLCLILMALLYLCSCEKELDFKYNDIDPIPVIEATLTPGGIEVSVTLTTPMNELLNRSPVKGLNVALTDLTDNVQYNLPLDYDGKYSSSVEGIQGHDYLLEVEGGSFHCKSYAKLFLPVEMDNLQFSWIKMPYDEVAVLKGSFSDNPAENGEYFWMKLYRNGEIYLWQTLDDRGAVNGKISFVTMTSRKDIEKEDDKKKLEPGDIITCSICRISRELHDYLEALENNSNGFPQFEGDLCLGFFLATSPVSQSITFDPASFN